MSPQQLSINAKAYLSKLSLASISKPETYLAIQLWLIHRTDIWLPGLLCLILGPLVALFIVSGAWHLVFATTLLVPAVVIFLRYPFVALLLWFCTAPFIQITPTAAHRVVYWLMHRALIPGALITTIIANQLRVKSAIRIRFNRADLAIFLAAMGLMISVILNYPSPQAMFINLYDRFFVPFCAYWFIRFTYPNTTDIKRLLPVVAGIIVFEVLIGLASWFTPAIVPDYWLNLQGFRTTGTFRSYPGYTIGLACCGLLVFYGATISKNQIHKWLYYISFSLSLFGIFISFSRGSWLAMLIILLGLALFYPKIIFRISLVGGLVGAVLGLTVMANMFRWADERLQDEDTAYNRLVIYYTSFRMIQARPFLGWGYEMYDQYDRDFETRIANYSNDKDHTSHNTLLTVLAERGIVGFGIYYFPAFWWLFLTTRYWPYLPKEGFYSRNLIFVLWLILVFQIIVGNFTDTKRDVFIFTTWWITLALISNIVDLYADKEANFYPELEQV